MDKLSEQVKTAVNELLGVAKLKAGDIFVVGCSSSEVAGDKIGCGSSPEIAKEIFDAVYEILREKNIFLAAQCCEHLNRALVVEAACTEKYGLEAVNAVPQVKAGGSFATAAYNAFSSPVLVESVSAKAGIDIGDTLIGMHLARVAVPVRLSVKKIGMANLVAARVRPKFVGGDRAVYDKDLM